MTIAIAIFAKNPNLSPVKTRLAQDIGKEKAILFYQLCLQCIRELLEELVAVSPLGITPYWALAEQESLSLPQWQYFNTLWTGEGDLGERLHHVYSSLLGKYEGVIIIGSDSPALTTGLLLNALEKLHTQADHIVIGPADDGGFYLFGGSVAIDKRVWLNTPYSRTETLALLLEQLQAFNIPATFIASHFDIDSGNGLRDLQNYLQSSEKLNFAQQNMLKFITAL